jgi:hypothetical protein
MLEDRPMAEPKTRPTTASVSAFLDRQTTPERRADCHAIARLLEKATGATPVMWGDAIVGFGSAPVVYANGTSMDWPLLAFSPRVQDIVLYGLPRADDFERRLAAVAPAKLKGSCVHLKRLSGIDPRALEALFAAAARGRADATASAKRAPAEKVSAKKAPATKQRGGR